MNTHKKPIAALGSGSVVIYQEKDQYTVERYSSRGIPLEKQQATDRKNAHDIASTLANNQLGL